MARKRSERSDNQPIICLGVYYLVVGLFIIGMTAAEERVWGFNWYAHFPTVWQILPLLFALAAGPVAWRLSLHFHRPISKEETGASPAGFLYVAIPMVLLSGLLYVLFPGRTHFLGDGYQLLSRLADGLGSVKSWDVGATLINDAVFALTEGDNPQRALTTYRIISVSAGLLMLGVTTIGAMLLFKDTPRRILFFLGLTTGGYALMFFGYVENYALLIALLTLYTLIGLLVLRGRLSAWWALPVMAAAGFIHIFGLTLLPSLVYLLLRRSGPVLRLAALPPKTKLIVGLVALFLGLALYHYLNISLRFFTFAFLPIIPDQFTVEGDYLLSVKHAIDTLNLLVLLVPGLFVLVVAIMLTWGKKFVESVENRFLLIVTLSTLAAVYVFNPGIGMPRNWDLFSIVGVPLAVMCYYALLSSRSKSVVPIMASSLACILGLMLLAPRVASQATPRVAIAHLKNYLELDKARNRNARRLLIDYYKQTGDSASAERELALATQDFPESGLNSRGKQSLQAGRFDQAEADFKKAIDLNPLFYDAYANLANCCIERGLLDSALVLLEVADGLNPYNATTSSNIGTVYLRLNKLDQSFNFFHEALRIDSSNQNGLVGLASAYLKAGQPERSIEYVTKLHNSSDIAYLYFQQATEAYLEVGFDTQARQAFGFAKQRGLGAAEIRSMIDRYPQLVE
ncbi:MAG: tetratricopeptide repeat protein [candidate division Zixibacteria bacterium]|nr:tetratricopeptide repeat protein [candidate division Zixibacteria bacterium]MDH3939101.1 tetratricopeptide repeat protein [candidate division Zixibacteria bacterium]MDH4034431.1 tetratricopeptide repeat protein [candidate division Zixibacteria bacterium]